MTSSARHSPKLIAAWVTSALLVAAVELAAFHLGQVDTFVQALLLGLWIALVGPLLSPLAAIVERRLHSVLTPQVDDEKVRDSGSSTTEQGKPALLSFGVIPPLALCALLLFLAIDPAGFASTLRTTLLALSLVAVSAGLLFFWNAGYLLVTTVSGPEGWSKAHPQSAFSRTYRWLFGGVIFVFVLVTLFLGGAVVLTALFLIAALVDRLITRRVWLVLASILALSIIALVWELGWNGDALRFHTERSLFIPAVIVKSVLLVALAILWHGAHLPDELNRIRRSILAALLRHWHSLRVRRPSYTGEQATSRRKLALALVVVLGYAIGTLAMFLWLPRAEGPWTQLEGMGLPIGPPPAIFDLAYGEAPKVLFAATSVGVFHSNDQGQSWQFSGPGLETVSVQTLLVAGSPSRLLGGTTEGTLYSYDFAAQRWTLLFDKLEDAPVSDLLALPATGELFAATDGAGVFHSLDGGRQWALLSRGMSDLQVQALAFDQSSGALFAGTRQSGVFRSEDRGQTWRPINGNFGSLNIQALVAADNQLLAGTASGLYRSDNGGQLWTGYSDTAVGRADVRALARDEVSGAFYIGTLDLGVFRFTTINGQLERLNAGAVGQQIQVLLSNPDGLFTGTADRGLARYNLETSSWQEQNGELSTLAIEALAATPVDGRLFAKTAAGLFRSDDGVQWHYLGGPLEGQTISAVAAAPDGALLVASVPLGLLRSTDGGVQWEILDRAIFGRYAPRALVSTWDGGPLLALFDGDCLASFDGGRTWRKATGGLPPGTSLTSIAVLAPQRMLVAGSDAGLFSLSDTERVWRPFESNLAGTVIQTVVDGADETLLVATGGGELARYDLAAGLWHPLAGTPPGGTVQALGVTEDGTILAGTMRGLFRSDTQGASWQPVRVEEDMPVRGAHLLFAAPGRPLLVGTILTGLFRSTDSGTTWAAASQGLTSVSVERLTVLRDGTLVSLIGNYLYSSRDRGHSWQPYGPPPRVTGQRPELQSIAEPISAQLSSDAPGLPAALQREGGRAYAYTLERPTTVLRTEAGPGIFWQLPSGLLAGLLNNVMRGLEVNHQLAQLARSSTPAAFVVVGGWLLGLAKLLAQILVAFGAWLWLSSVLAVLGSTFKMRQHPLILPDSFKAARLWHLSPFRILARLNRRVQAQWNLYTFSLRVAYSIFVDEWIRSGPVSRALLIKLGNEYYYTQNELSEAVIALVPWATNHAEHQQALKKLVANQLVNVWEGSYWTDYDYLVRLLLEEYSRSPEMLVRREVVLEDRVSPSLLLWFGIEPVAAIEGSAYLPYRQAWLALPPLARLLLLTPYLGLPVPPWNWSSVSRLEEERLGAILSDYNLSVDREQIHKALTVAAQSGFLTGEASSWPLAQPWPAALIAIEFLLIGNGLFDLRRLVQLQQPFAVAAFTWLDTQGPLARLTLLAFLEAEALDMRELQRCLSELNATFSRSQLQELIDQLFERQLIVREGPRWRLTAPDLAPTVTSELRVDRAELARQTVNENPLYRDLQQFLERSGFSLERTHPFGLLARSEQRIWADVSPLFVWMVLQRRLDSGEFQELRSAAQEVFDGKLTDRVALVVIDRRPESKDLYQIFALRDELRFTIVPVSSALIEQARPPGQETNDLRKQLAIYIGNENLYGVKVEVTDDLSFFGRSATLADLERRLTSGRSVIIFGVRKIGKTSLLGRLRQQCRWPIARINLQGGEDLETVYQDALEAWQSSLRSSMTLPELVGLPFRQAVGALLDALAEQEGRPGLILFLDEMDELYTTPGYLAFAGTLRRIAEDPRYRGRFAIALAGYDPRLNRYDRLDGGRNPFFEFFEELPLGLIDREDAKLMIDSIGSQMGIRYTSDALELLATSAGGHPFLTRQVCFLAVRDLNPPVEINLDRASWAVHAYLREALNYFSESLWSIDRGGPPPAEREILLALTAADSSPEEELIPSELPLSLRRASQLAIDHLRDQSLIRLTARGWAHAIPLYREWISLNLLLPQPPLQPPVDTEGAQ